MGEKAKSFDEEWEVIHRTMEWGKYPAEHVIRFIARNYYKMQRSKIKILDYGCGGGAHTWYLAREGFDVYAFDGSPSAIATVKKRLDMDGLKANLKVADALEIDYPKEFFDAVVDNVCIYANMSKNIQMMYNGVYRILRSGGKLLTTCFGEKTDGYGSGRKLEKDTYADIEYGNLAGRGTAHFFSKEELEEDLKVAGFSNITIDKILYTDNQVQIEQFVAVGIK